LTISDFNENKAVARLSELTALTMGVCPAKARQIKNAAALHDIGKQKLPAGLLEKPGKLTAREFEVVKTHTKLGAEMLKSAQGELGEMVKACCLWHHEWYDGGGYWGRRTDDLPFYLPFVAMSDVFTALISERPYKAAWPLGDAVDYIRSKAGTQFKPELTEIFIWLVRNDKRVWDIFTRSNQKGKVII
jgi:putative nucleotidyltransferase with HDIG domain